jgi:hypothetical protein
MLRGGSIRTSNLRGFSLSVCTVWLLASQLGLGQVAESLSSSGRNFQLIEIAPAMEYGETFQGPVDLSLTSQNPDLAWDPNYAPKSETLAAKSQNVIFRGTVHCLEFSFKPVRLIEIDIPQVTGVERNKVWYLLYRVRYLGGELQPLPEPDPYGNQVFAAPQSVSRDWVRFMPTFELEPKGLGQRHLDQIIPAAKRAIAAKERVGRPIYDSVEIQKLKIEVSTAGNNKEVWGVATWTDVDPRTDFFSVNVQGLTNAQQLEMDGDQINYLQKTLVLHFSRPGDTINEMDDRIRYGIPALEDPERQKYVLDQFGVQERLDHLWTYR